MDPQMIQQLMQGGGQQGGSPMNFDQNPFMDLMQGGSGAQASAPAAPASAQPQMGPDGQPIVPEALQPGKTGDNSQSLLGAISQLHRFVAGSTDPEEIQMVRQIVSLLTNLVARDQERSGQMMMEGGAPQPQAPAPQAPTPAPTA